MAHKDISRSQFLKTEVFCYHEHFETEKSQNSEEAKCKFYEIDSNLKNLKFFISDMINIFWAWEEQ